MTDPLDRLNSYFGEYEEPEDYFSVFQGRPTGFDPAAGYSNYWTTDPTAAAQWGSNVYETRVSPQQWQGGVDPALAAGVLPRAVEMGLSRVLPEHHAAGATRYQPGNAPGDPTPVQATATRAIASPAPEPIAFERAWTQPALDRAQQVAQNYIPDPNEAAGRPSGFDAQGQGFRMTYGGGEIALNRTMVDEARTEAANILGRARPALRGTTGGQEDPSKMVANYKEAVKQGIDGYWKGQISNIERDFKDDPGGKAEAKQLAQNMRNMLFRATNQAIKGIAEDIGGGNFRDYAGSVRVSSVAELEQIAQTDPRIAQEIADRGGMGAFVAGGGGYLGGGGQGPGYLFGGDRGGGGGGQRGGRQGMWGGGMGAAMYGMYIGQRLWGYTGGGVLERGAAYGGMVGEMGAGLPFGPGGFGARAALSQMQGGRGAYPYAGAAQGLGMMINERMPGAMAATGMVAGLGAMTNLGANLAMQVGGEGMLGTIGGKVAGVLGKVAAPVGAYMAGVNLFNLFGGERLLGREADLLDPFRAIAAAGVQTSELYQQDPAEWARQNAGLATFITSAESGLTPQQERIQDIAGRNAALWNMEPTAVAASYIGFDRAGLFPSQRTIPETGYRSRRARAGGRGGRVGGATDEYISTTMQADEYYMSEYRNRAAGMDVGMEELQTMEFEIAAQFGAPGTEAFRTAMTRMGRLTGLQQYGDVRRQASRFAQVAGMVQPYQDIDRTRMMLRQEQLAPADFMRYGQYQTQFAQLGVGAEQADIVSAQMARMNVSTGGGFMNVASAAAPYMDYTTQAGEQFLQQGAAAFGQLSPDQQGLMGRMFEGNLNAFNYAGLTGQFGIGSEFVSRDIAGAPIYQTDMQGFMDWGVAQAQMGINPEANRLFGAAADMTPILGLAGGRRGGRGGRGGFGGAQPTLLAQLNATMGQFGAQFTQQDVDDATSGYRGYTGFQAITARYQDTIHGFQQAQAGLAMRGIAAKQEYLWGGGTPTAPGAGSLWGLQDTQRGLQWQAQQAGFAQTRQGLDTRNIMAQEREAISELRMETNVDYRRWMRGFQRGGMDIQRGYAMEDRQYQDQMRDLQWGWGLEDIDESIRLSSGRQRRTLVRQRGRMVTKHTLEDDQIETQRERQEEQWARQDERFDKQVEYEEDLMQLDRMTFELNRDQRQEIYELDLGNLERHIQEAQKMHDINDKIIAKQRAFQAAELDRQKQQVGIQSAMAAATHEYNMKAQAVEYTFKRTEDAFKNIAANTRSILVMTAMAALVEKTNNLAYHKPAAIVSMIDSINRLNVAKLSTLVSVLDLIR